MSDRANGRPIRVLRVIARLNVGGPALHVTYLARGLAERGYETTLVAGDVARGEESMAFVADRAGVEVVRLPGPVPGALPGAGRARGVAPGADHPARPARRRPHAHRQGGRGRTRRRAARGQPTRPVVVHTFHGHVLRGYFGRGGTLLFRAIETVLARATDRLVAVSPEVRDELVGLARGAARGSSR